jgi:hypothetical protein
VWPKVRAVTRLPEKAVRAYLLMGLRSLGQDAHWEIRAIDAGQVRFDIVVYEQRAATRIIEVKKRRTAGFTANGIEFVAWHKSPDTERQLESYRQFGLPVDLVQGLEQAERYLHWFRSRSWAVGNSGRA